MESTTNEASFLSSLMANVMPSEVKHSSVVGAQTALASRSECRHAAGTVIVAHCKLLQPGYMSSPTPQHLFAKTSLTKSMHVMLSWITSLGPDRTSPDLLQIPRHGQSQRCNTIILRTKGAWCLSSSSQPMPQHSFSIVAAAALVMSTESQCAANIPHMVHLSNSIPTLSLRSLSNLGAAELVGSAECCYYSTT